VCGLLGAQAASSVAATEAARMTRRNQAGIGSNGGLLNTFRELA